MSLLRRIWNNIRNPAIYAGRDLEGNKFYEYPASSPDPRRTRRVVQYRHPDNMWDYIGGGKRLAIQWSSWLSHTRRDPPTTKELEDDLTRQIRLRRNVAMIEARDNAERARMIEEGAAAVEEARQSAMEHILQGEQRSSEPCTEASPPVDQANLTQKQVGQEQSSSESGDEKVKSTSPWIECTEDTLKLQEWTPRSCSRRD